MPFRIDPEHCVVILSEEDYIDYRDIEYPSNPAVNIEDRNRVLEKISKNHTNPKRDIVNEFDLQISSSSSGFNSLAGMKLANPVYVYGLMDPTPDNGRKYHITFSKFYTNKKEVLKAIFTLFEDVKDEMGNSIGYSIAPTDERRAIGVSMFLRKNHLDKVKELIRIFSGKEIYKEII